MKKQSKISAPAIILCLIVGFSMAACATLSATLSSTETQLIAAIQSNDTAEAIQLIQIAHDLNFITESGSFPLLEAARAGDLDLVELLVSRGADINLENQKGMTALMAATYHEHPAVVDYLILQGADLEKKNFKNYTALHFAVDRGHEKLMSLLLDHTNADVYDGEDAVSLLMPAIDNDDAATVAWLLDKNISPEAPNDKTVPPLAAAAVSPEPEIVGLLLKHGADVHAKDRNGCDALWRVGTLDKPFYAEKIYALSNPEFFKKDPTGMETEGSDKTRIEFRNLLKTLELAPESSETAAKIKQLKNNYDYGYLFSDISEDTLSAVSQRLETDYSAVANQLLAAGADINTTDKNKRSILHVICNQQEKDIDALFSEELFPLDEETRSRLRVVIDQADRIHSGLILPFFDTSGINQPDAYGNTPLIHACSKNANPSLVKILIEKNANLNAANKDGWTPLITAAYVGRYEAVQLLVEHGADVNVANRFGETAILRAVYNNDAPMVELLLTHGADINHPNQRGDTPLSAATKRENTEILALFEKIGDSH